ncbi:MAG: acyl-CoA dehydrogenase [Actinomycetota bacterium]
MSELETVDPLITETANRLFGELCTHEAIQAAEDQGDAPEIWAAFAETGFPWISLPEAAGGSGGTLLDALEVLRLVGYHAAPIPAAETGMLGGWLLTSGGLELPEGIVTVASDHSLTIGDAGKVSGTASMVPWGRSAERLAFVADGKVASVPVAAATVVEQRALSGEPRDTLTFDATAADVADAPSGIDDESLRFRGALSRVAMMGGAIEKMSQLTVSYTNERQQFGRPIARFQAVQAHLVWAAQDAALGRMAAESAGHAAYRGDGRFEIAAAKLNCNQAATRATKACHQAHGAMGMTQEYPLHHYSRRLWTWRTEYGGTSEWSRWVGAAAAEAGADGLYPLITGGSAA